jgi:pantoate--beta-alanine ligase
LLQMAAENGQKVVCSIFVNPTQFNDPADYDRYPRDVQKDIQSLNPAHCNMVFTPSVKTVYPTGTVYNETVDLQGIDERMEGATRPGHFKGVVQVVKRLFDLVQPHKAYFGLKDYQQYLVIKTMTAAFNLPIEIIGVNTIREKDGLAMSSRNALLTEEDRHLAPVIYQLLQDAAQRYANREPLAHIRILAEQRLAQLPGVKPEYFEIADAETLQPVYEYTNRPARIFVACP